MLNFKYIYVVLTNTYILNVIPYVLLATGKGQVIRGFDEGLLGSCVGEQRRLVIPPQLGYGEAGAGDVIPPQATLVFNIDIVNIQVWKNNE